jgi:hypothetical protein
MHSARLRQAQFSVLYSALRNYHFGQQQMIPDTFYHQTCDSRHNFVGKTVKTVLVSKCGQKSEGAGNLSLSYYGENELLAGRAIKSGRVIHFLWPAFI